MYSGGVAPDEYFGREFLRTKRSSIFIVPMATNGRKLLVLNIIMAKKIFIRAYLTSEVLETSCRATRYMDYG